MNSNDFSNLIFGGCSAFLGLVDLFSGVNSADRAVFQNGACGIASGIAQMQAGVTGQTYIPQPVIYPVLPVPYGQVPALPMAYGNLLQASALPMPQPTIGYPFPPQLPVPGTDKL